MIAYRTKGASKVVPSFDVIDYGQEDYVFGDSDTNARHWNKWVLKALQENQETLASLFEKNKGTARPGDIAIPGSCCIPGADTA